MPSHTFTTSPSDLLTETPRPRPRPSTTDAAPAPTLTILAHPDSERVGERARLAALSRTSAPPSP